MAWHYACWCILSTFRIVSIVFVVCSFFKFWHYFDLMKRVKFGVSGNFLENAWREWPEILHADVSWPPSKLISLWWWFVDCSNFGAILTKWNAPNLGFPGISWRMHGGNGLKFCMLLHPGDLPNWLDYSLGLVIVLILALFWLGETGQIWGFRPFLEEHMEGMAWKFACWFILTPYRTD